jgi:hypothetical protein
MQIIHNWLKGRQNFIVGATLYKTFGKDQKLKDLFVKGETATAKLLLCEALQKIVAPEETGVAETVKNVTKIETNVPVTAKPVPPVETKADKETAQMPGSADPILNSLKNEWQPLYQRMNLLRHSLDKFEAINTEEAINFRRPIAREIKELDLQCKAIWAKRDYYLKEGKLPFTSENKIVIPADPVELAKLINNIKRYIRRYRTLMNKPGNPKTAQLYIDYKAKYKLVTGEDYEETN